MHITLTLLYTCNIHVAIRVATPVNPWMQPVQLGSLLWLPSTKHPFRHTLSLPHSTLLHSLLLLLIFL